MNYLTGIKLEKELDSSSYISYLPIVKYLQTIECLEFEKPLTFFVGENGSGKSTLLEAIAISMGFNPEGGSRDFSFSTKDSHSNLYNYIRTIKTIPPKDGFFLRAESFYNTASYLDRNSTLERYGGISFHAQSHGQSFFNLILNRFSGNGLYILDEPEAALSPERLLSLIVLIDKLVKNNSQLLIATHSPILMAYPKADILSFSEEGIKRVNYKDTSHYKITRQFLNNPEQMLNYLLKE